MSIVFGLYDCIWILRLYLDCVNCIWIVSIVFGLCRLYLDCTIAGFGTMWCSITYTPPPLVTKKVVPKRMLSIAFGLFRLYLDCVDYIWIVLIVCRPTALYRRQAGVQECIKGYTWSV